MLAIALLVSSSYPAIAASDAKGVPDAPPRPVVITENGMAERAARGSYCWTVGDRGICSDSTDPIEFAPKLRARPGSDLIIRMRYPVERLSASDGLSGDRLQPESVNDEGRRFRLRLPEGEEGRTVDLHLFARYDRGDGSFALRVRQPVSQAD